MSKSAAQKLDDAMDRVEKAAMDLIERAELYAEQNSLDSRKWQRFYLLGAARTYAAAIRHLARVR